jgi:hypothetical protein
MLSLRHRFLFLHIPKTGGSSLCEALAPYSEDRIVRVKPWDRDQFELNSPLLGLPSKHAQWADYAEEITPGEMRCLHPFRVFSIVRNPWDRMVSYWYSPHHPPFIPMEHASVKTMAVFLDRVQPCVNYWGCVDNVEFMLRFEHLEADFVRLCDWLGLPRLRLPHRMKSWRRHYSTYYHEDTRALVADKFAEEIEQFGYTFEDVSRETSEETSWVES